MQSSVAWDNCTAWHLAGAVDGSRVYEKGRNGTADTFKAQVRRLTVVCIQGCRERRDPAVYSRKPYPPVAGTQQTKVRCKGHSGSLELTTPRRDTFFELCSIYSRCGSQPFERMEGSVVLKLEILITESSVGTRHWDFEQAP